MAVQVQVDFDATEADKGLNELQEGAAQNFKDLGKIAEESLKFEKIKAGLEGLKVFSEALGPIMGEAEKATAKTFEQMAKLGDAGFKIGSAFGPLGGLIGGVLGALSGYFIAAINKSSELTKKIHEIRSAAYESRQSLLELDTVTMGQISAEIDKFRDKIYLAGKEGEAARNAIKGIFEIGATNLAEQFDKAATSADGLKEATIAILKPIELTADQAREAINTNIDLIKDTKAEIKKTADEIKANLARGFNDESTLKSQEKLLEVLKGRLKDYGKAQTDAAGALRKALDKEIKDEEDSKKKAAEAAQKREEKINADLIKSRNARIKEEEKVTAAIAAREQKWYDDALAAQEWADTVKRVEYEVNIARLQAAENLKQINKTEQEARLAAEEANKAVLLKSWQDLAAGYQNALQPLADITAAVFGTITSNIEKGNKAFAGVGIAAKQAISEVLKSFGKQWSAQALSEFAAGLASLALGPVGGVSAAAHFAAAAGYGAAAAAAGVGGAVIARSANSPGGGAASPSTPAPSSNNGSPFIGNFRGNGNNQTVIVQMSNNLFMGNGDDRSLEEPGRILGKSLQVASAADKRLTS